jgi:hypothetical protein
MTEKSKPSVQLYNVGLEEDPITKDIILRGTLDQTTLRYINCDWYQREQGFSNSHNNEIEAAFFAGNKISDITLGMRGNRCTETKDNVYHLLDKCYCIDGGQRLYAAGMAIMQRPDLKIHLGAKVYFNTNEDIENEMFCKLGTTQVRVAASVLLRNRMKKSEAANLLVKLNSDDRFALKNRVQWNQVRTRHELISGFSFARVIGALHAHKGGALKSSKTYELLAALDQLVTKIGEENFTENCVRFFDAIDKCWTLRQLSGAREEHRPHLELEFLLTIAGLLSTYSEFWDGTPREFFNFPDKYIKRLRGFKLSDYLNTTPRVPKDALWEILRKRLNLAPIFADDAEAAE